MDRMMMMMLMVSFLFFLFETIQKKSVLFAIRRQYHSHAFLEIPFNLFCSDILN